LLGTRRPRTPRSKPFANAAQTYLSVRDQRRIFPLCSGAENSVHPAAGPYSEVFVDDGSKWMTLRSMKEWQVRLAGAAFATIHRSVIVNLNFVERVEPLPNSLFAVVLRGTQRRLPMSRTKALLLKQRWG